MTINLKSILTFAGAGALLIACQVPSDNPGTVPASSGQAITADGSLDFTGAGSAVLEEMGVEAPEAPEAPEVPAIPETPVWVELELGGDASMPEADPSCLNSTASAAFDAVFEGEGSVDSTGFYLAGLEESSFNIEAAAPECEFEQPDIENIREATLRVEIGATAPVCEAYCSSAARSIAEAECGSDLLDTACLAATEAATEASCNLNCAEEAWVIVAEASLSADAMAELAHELGEDGASVNGNASGNARMSMDLSFSRMENEDGEEVPEVE